MNKLFFFFFLFLLVGMRLYAMEINCKQFNRAELPKDVRQVLKESCKRGNRIIKTQQQELRELYSQMSNMQVLYNNAEWELRYRELRSRKQ